MAAFSLHRTSQIRPVRAIHHSFHMNRLASILSPAQVLVSVDATSKKRAFEEGRLRYERHKHKK